VTAAAQAAAICNLGLENWPTQWLAEKGSRISSGASRGSRTRAVSASAFEFISENRQIASIHEFMESLSKTLRC
jgi:hypothetical protein